MDKQNPKPLSPKRQALKLLVRGAKTFLKGAELVTTLSEKDKEWLEKRVKPKLEAFEKQLNNLP